MATKMFSFYFLSYVVMCYDYGIFSFVLRNEMFKEMRKSNREKLPNLFLVQMKHNSDIQREERRKCQSVYNSVCGSL